MQTDWLARTVTEQWNSVPWQSSHSFFSDWGVQSPMWIKELVIKLYFRKFDLKFGAASIYWTWTRGGGSEGMTAHGCRVTSSHASAMSDYLGKSVLVIRFPHWLILHFPYSRFRKTTFDEPHVEMKRRSIDPSKLRRPLKRSRITESIYGR